MGLTGAEGVGGSDIGTTLGRNDPAARRMKNRGFPCTSRRQDFEDRRGEADRFTVDADDRPGLLLAITTALFNERVSIQGAEVLTVDGRAHDEFDVLEWNGAPVSEQRKAVIAESVAAAIAAIG